MRLIRVRTAAAILLFGIVCLAGCGTRTVYISDGDPVRVRKTVKKVDIWAQDKDGKWVPGTLDIPEGWYALPDPGKKADGGSGGNWPAH